MAHYGIRRNKNGNITSVRICIYKDGYQINKFYRPVRPGMTDEEIMAAAEEYGEMIEAQLKTDGSLSIFTPFREAAEYYIRLGMAFGDTPATEQFYRAILIRINDPEYGFGDVPIGEISTGTVNRFLIHLAMSECRYSERVRCIIDFRDYLDRHGMSIYSLAKEIGISDSTLYSCREGNNILRSKAEKICEYFGEDLSSMFERAECSTRRLSSTYMNSHITFIRSVLSQAVRENVLKFNPADSTRKFKGVVREQSVLSINELRNICDLLSSDDDLEMVAFTMLLIFTGARNGEICGIRWENVNFKTSEIFLCNNLHQVTGEGVIEGPLKNKGNRLISVDPGVMEILMRWKEKQQELWPGSEYVFTGKNGTHMYPTSPAKWLRGFSDDHDLPYIHPHMFRHSHASILIAEGEDIATVSKRLGHTSISTTTKIYLHPLKEKDRTASSLFTRTILT